MMRKHANLLGLVALAFITMLMAPTQAKAQRVLADYDVINDGSFTLSGSSRSKALTIYIQTGAVTNQRAVLMFQVNPELDSGSDRLKLEVQIKDKILSTYTFGTDAQRGIWEVFLPTDVDLREGNNSMEFRFNSGAGTLKVSDVVLFYQRKVE
jgi:hypothetical protein